MSFVYRYNPMHEEFSSQPLPKDIITHDWVSCQISFRSMFQVRNGKLDARIVDLSLRAEEVTVKPVQD